MEFEFNKQLSAQNQIDIENIGSFALEAYNDAGAYYYYLVKTILGQCVIASCGPVIPDIANIPSGFSVNLYKMPYNEIKLIKSISLFLNDKYKQITEATEIDIEDAIEQFRDIKEYLKTLDAGNL